MSFCEDPRTIEARGIRGCNSLDVGLAALADMIDRETAVWERALALGSEVVPPSKKDRWPVTLIRRLLINMRGVV
jgi:hypothetical protein